MKVIIDPYRGGTDTGKSISNKYEKNILLDLSKTMSSALNDLGINTELVRTTDISLTDDERNSIINELKDNKDLIVQNRLSDSNELNIIYPLRYSDTLPSLISNELEANGINVTKYYQRRLPTDTMLDYYSITRNTKPNEVLIIEFKEPSNNQNIINIIAKVIGSYINQSNTYKVVYGDSLYQIAKKFNITVGKLKELNNLSSNLLSVGQILKIPSSEKAKEESYNTYTVIKGDSLYQIAKKYNTTVDKIKSLNGLSNNLISIGQVLKIPQLEEEYINYTVIKGDSLYQIAKKYNTTVDEVKGLNGLKSNLLNIGQVLKIPR